MVRNDERRTFSAREARQGDIELRTPLRKAVFIAGLAGFVLLSLLLSVAGCIPTP